MIDEAGTWRVIRRDGVTVDVYVGQDTLGRWSAYFGCDPRHGISSACGRTAVDAVLSLVPLIRMNADQYAPSEILAPGEQSADERIARARQEERDVGHDICVTTVRSALAETTTLRARIEALANKYKRDVTEARYNESTFDGLLLEFANELHGLLGKEKKP